MRWLLDTSALLVFYRKEPAVDQVLALFDDPANELLLCAISVTEFGRKLYELGQTAEEVEHAIDLHRPLFARIEKVDEIVARNALRLVRNMTTRLAMTHQACLVHRDQHMAAIPPELLPTLDLARGR